jgi:hypothetical protein
MFRVKARFSMAEVRDLKIRVDQLFPRGYHVHHTMGGSGF